MRSIEHEAILFRFVGKLGGVLRKDRQLGMQRSYRYGRKGKQVHPQVSERRQQFVRFSGIVSHGCGEVVDASYMKCHSCLAASGGGGTAVIDCDDRLTRIAAANAGGC